MTYDLSTLQGIFDRVVDHLRTQKAQSKLLRTDGHTICTYRGINGLKCAVGCLILDENYTFKLEGLFVDDKSVIEALTASGVCIERNNLCMLGELQMLHDGFSYGDQNWKEIELQFMQIADKYSVEYTDHVL